MNSIENTVAEKIHNPMNFLNKNTMSNKKSHVQSSTHVRGTTYSNDDHFECFFSGSESKGTSFNPALATVSILAQKRQDYESLSNDSEI